jgi:hypothetical protein
LTTIGVTSWNISNELAGLSTAGTGRPGSGRSRYDHASFSVETFVVLICVSGE